MTCIINRDHEITCISFPCRRALNLGILRDPGSEVEDRQYQIDLQSINIGTAQWEQLKPEKEGLKGGAAVESERSSQNPALEWNMASRSAQVLRTPKKCFFFTLIVIFNNETIYTVQ